MYPLGALSRRPCRSQYVPPADRRRNPALAAACCPAEPGAAAGAGAPAAAGSGLNRVTKPRLAREGVSAPAANAAGTAAGAVPPAERGAPVDAALSGSLLAAELLQGSADASPGRSVTGVPVSCCPPASLGDRTSTVIVRLGDGLAQ